VVEPNRWTPVEDAARAEARRRDCPVLVVVNKADLEAPRADWLAELRARVGPALVASCLDAEGRERTLTEFTARVGELARPGRAAEPPLLGDLLPAGGLLVMVVPIDLQAPKGRLILPQVQAIRDALDHDAGALVVKDREYAAALARLGVRPDLVVCDSQVVLKTVADTPPGVRCTTFSILFARHRGDLAEFARGAAALGRLRPGDRVLVAEACTHHALEDDIGRVKIPRWLRQYVGGDLAIDTVSGRDFPADLAAYRAAIHCGSCMLNRRETLARVRRAREAGVPITNYGVAISFLQGVLDRVLEPFPAAREAAREARRETSGRTNG
jgi:[FeFe] hydrogenase H-cluster maturation GTPase HydF